MDRGCGKELHVWAEIIASILADLAAGAADPRLYSYPVSYSQILHLTTNLLYDPRAFMPNYHWFFHDEIRQAHCLQIQNCKRCDELWHN